MDVLARMRHSCPVGDYTVRRSDVVTNPVIQVNAQCLVKVRKGNLLKSCAHT